VCHQWFRGGAALSMARRFVCSVQGTSRIVRPDKLLPLQTHFSRPPKRSPEHEFVVEHSVCWASCPGPPEIQLSPRWCSTHSPLLLSRFEPTRIDGLFYFITSIELSPEWLHPTLFYDCRIASFFRTSLCTYPAPSGIPQKTAVVIVRFFFPIRGTVRS